MDCVFCRIVKKKIPATILYENDHVVVFEDQSPQAPVHALIVPKIHLASILECHRKDDAIWIAVLDAIKLISHAGSFSEKGFRIVINTGDDGGQTVDHLHVHCLAGRRLSWPPG